MAILHVTHGPTVQILKVMVDLDSVQFLKLDLFWIRGQPCQGSFQCKCKVGYEGNGFECTLIDSCAPAGRCANGECIILPGGFKCRCDVGYQG